MGKLHAEICHNASPSSADHKLLYSQGICARYSMHRPGVPALQGMREAYQVYMDTLRAELGSAPPVAVATIAQRAQDSAEGVHSQTRILQGLAAIMLLILLLLSWNVMGLRRTSRQQLQLLQQLAESSSSQASASVSQCRSGI